MTNELRLSIQRAVEEGRKKDLITLLDAHPEALHENGVFGTWLHIAASENQLEIAKELVKRGADVNAVGGIGDGNALNEAATEGHFELVKYLLEAGSEMDVSNSERNPLWGAILRDNWKIVQLLIDHGIDYTVKYGDDQMDAEAFAREQGAGHCHKLLEETRKKSNAR